MKIAAFFPGQGSQSVGMAKSLFDADERVRSLFSQADEVLGFRLSDLCFNGPLEQLTLTQFAQPALLTASFAAFLVADAPNIVVAAGHSLGEYSALVAAGALEFADAVLLVHKRGQYMQQAVAPGLGKMIAVMGPSEADIQAAISEVEVGTKEVANLNCPGQTVVAGDVAGIDALAKVLTSAGAKVIPLNVSAPFHCSLMQPAAENLAQDLENIVICSPRFPVVANISAAPLTEPEQIRQALKAQVCGTVRWTECVQRIIADFSPQCGLEFGPGGVLSRLARRIDKAFVCKEVGTVEQIASLKDMF